MKTSLQSWLRGIGVLGLYICLSTVMAAVGLASEALPANMQLVGGLALFILAVPPLFHWIFRWIYPEVAIEKGPSPKDGRKPQG